MCVWHALPTATTATKIYKYDLRVCQPNQDHMEMPALHSLEHLMAELSRNHSDKIVDISPMGCQTGFLCNFVEFARIPRRAQFD